MKKGFTLIELLVVIAILAVLATAVVIILNPAELLKQGRDSTRLSDLSALQSSIALYLSDVASPSMPNNNNCTNGTTSPFVVAVCVENANTTVGGAGWVAVDFSAISSGSPLSRLPLDPTNDAINYYAYAADLATLTYEIDANLESAKFIP